jgi:preprotein translocase SecF subunit
MIEKVKSLTTKDYTVRRSEFVGPVVGDELKIAGMLAVSLALLSIMVYIWFRFEWQFSIAAIIALTHDVLTTVGLFSILQLEFNLATIAAILTTAGYSINDTVVIFDRVRENLRRYKSKDHYFIYNKSINETLSRTVITSVTTLIALFIIFFFGGAVLSDFALAMIWGVLIGTFSSIFVAVSLLTFFKINKGDKVDDQSNIPEYERNN